MLYPLTEGFPVLGCSGPAARSHMYENVRACQMLPSPRTILRPVPSSHRPVSFAYEEHWTLPIPAVLF